MKKILFVINPIAGKAQGKALKTKIEAYFEHHPAQITCVFTAYEGHAKEIVSDYLPKKMDCIVACGGDGTINEVAQALVNQSTPLGIIPIGSGNGLASHLNIPKNFTKALDLIAQHQVSLIDVGRVNSNYFFSNMGIGIDAKVIHQYAKAKNRNFYGYFKSTLESLIHYQSLQFQLEIDQKFTTWKPYFFVLCSNSNEAGYGISFTPKAALNDGKIDLLCVEHLKGMEYFQFVLAVLLKRLHVFKKASIVQVDRILITSKQKRILSQIDGEAIYLETEAIKIDVLKNALPIIKTMEVHEST